ncbi:hypothetical protein MSAN_01131100 [Mycena sanguinolenta]|uniref:F-box domain-containing protein n=1 Tax=Mycena sanguinolenta TaxID=230812 RepID=A0A8H6YMG7_9AGAR|nr:hypothetical protein MSAN_01131100 [Mycena sanguinolenta]
MIGDIVTVTRFAFNVHQTSTVFIDRFVDMDPDEPDYIALPFFIPLSEQRADRDSTTNRIATECLRQLNVERCRIFGGKPPKTLDIFPRMPIDIILEVLNFLHPLDLLHLSRTTRDFRTLLHQPAQDAIWCVSFTAPLPMCPSNITGRRWAQLLFGPYFCEECGRGGTLPDFGILRRLCTRCLERLLVDVRSLYHGDSAAVSQLIPWTRREAGSENPWDGKDRHRVLISEARSVIEEYEACERDQSPEPDHSGPLAAFIQRRLDLMQERHRRLLQGKVWVRGVSKARADHEAECANKIQASVKKRLLKEGYDPRDMKYIRGTVSDLVVICRLNRLSSRNWKKTRPAFLAGVLGAKRVRLSYEVEARQSVIENVLEGFLSQRQPSTWAYTPGISDVIQFPEFQRLLEDTEGEVLAPDDPLLVTALEQLPARLEAWSAAERASLAARAPHSNASEDVLVLATTVFTCGGTYPWHSYFNPPHCCLVGWKGAGACRGPTCYVSFVKFSERGSTAARALVRLAGLDPQEATADQMDALDLRFVCNDCLIQQWGQVVMTWRRCLQHALDRALEESEPVRHVSSWALLSPLGAKDVRRREYNKKDYSRRDPIWLCNLCSAHFHRCREYADVVEHVSTEHDIARPKQGLHFIDRVGGHRPPRPSMFLSYGVHAAEYRCNQCAAEKPNSVKLMALRAVIAHVRAKHPGVLTEPGYTRVERLIRSFPDHHIVMEEVRACI